MILWIGWAQLGRSQWGEGNLTEFHDCSHSESMTELAIQGGIFTQVSGTLVKVAETAGG